MEENYIEVFLILCTRSSGNYTCVAQNTHGTDSVSYHVRVQTPPQPPILQIAEATYEALRLTWTPMPDGGSPLKGT